MSAKADALVAEIYAVRTALRRFDSRQTDFAVRFHIAVVDVNLRAASEGRDDPIFLEGFAINVRDLAVCIHSPGNGCGSARCLFCQAALDAKA
jgi:hypothetical protein